MTCTYTSFTDVQQLEHGAVFACPTDTVYGLSCSVKDAEAVVKVRSIKGKGADVPLIVLIANFEQLEQFGITLSTKHRDFLEKIWPGAVSVVTSGVSNTYSHISPDGSLAVRMPDRADLREFLVRFGPIVSTSANKHGEKPCTNLNEILAVFPTELDCVVDTGVCDAPPSTLIKIIR
jgi:L-threonylcarbamoyladenylate synthase